MKIRRWLHSLRWRRWRLTYKLLLIYMPLIIIPLLTGLYFVTNLYDNMSREQTREHTEELLNIMVSELEDQFKSFEDGMLTFFTDDDILAALETRSESPMDREIMEIERKLRDRKSDFFSNYIYQKSMIIASPYHDFVLGERYLQFKGTEGFVEEIHDRDGAPVWRVVQNVYTNDTMILLGRLINEIEHFTTKGHVIFIIDPRAFKDVLQGFEVSQSIQYSMVSERGENLLDFQQGMIEKDEPTMEMPMVSGKYGWTLTATIPLSHLYETIEEARSFMILVVIICVAVGLIVTRLFSIDFVIPIKKMMHNIKQGILGLQPNKLKKFRGAREIVELNDTFISVMYEVFNLNKEILLTQQKKQEADIQVLQQQLSPHFLYNTLNSIRWMAMIHKQNNIKEMVDSLINLLSYSIRDIGEPVFLNDEMIILQDYVKIQKVRYQDFVFQIDVEENLKKAKIPKFLLQPIIENSIIHGLSNSGRTGVVDIKAYTKRDHLILEMTDNGKGITEDKLNEIKNSLLHDNKSNHLGLKNINDRIQLHYGKSYGLSIESQEDKGSNVTIHLPLFFENEGEEMG